MSSTTQDRSKLIATKERWARERRGLTGLVETGRSRVPPGQHLVKDWPVLDLGNQPAVELRDWQLTVGGLVAAPLTWTWDDLQRQPQILQTSDMHCVTAWSRLNNRFRGVAFQHLLATVRPRPEAKFVFLKSFDGYMTNVPLAAIEDREALLATHWEDQPLTREHGGPVRALLPKLYLWKSAKWIRQVWFSDRDTPGYWEARGYHPLGDPWREERYGA